MSRGTPRLQRRDTAGSAPVAVPSSSAERVSSPMDPVRTSGLPDARWHNQTGMRSEKHPLLGCDFTFPFRRGTPRGVVLARAVEGPRTTRTLDLPALFSLLSALQPRLVRACLEA